MPLADSEIAWIEQHRQVLSDYADKIDACISNSEWEKLTIILQSRQVYLEQLFTDSIPEDRRKAAQQLASTLLEQDQLFQTKLQEQKNMATQLNQNLQRGRRAIKAYNSQ